MTSPTTTPATILVTTDFSELSAEAFPHAVRFAAALDARIRLLHVCDALPPEGGDRHKAWEADMEAYVAERLEYFQTELAALGTDVETRCAHGLAAREILESIDESTALAVLATHSRTGLRRLFVGSVAAKVIRGSVAPVLCVGADMVDRPIQRILMPTDFSELTTGAFAEAVELARRFDATIEFFHAYLPRQASQMSYSGLLPESDADTDLRTRCTARLDDFARSAIAAGVPATRVLHEDTRPADAIVDAIANTDPDLVIMPAHGYTGFSRWLLGSVTEEVVRRSDRPVLVLKPLAE